MSLIPLPPPEAVNPILIWHQGALGDLLLAGPALMAVRGRYPGARLVGLGHPERWGLLSTTLSLAEVWDSSESRWAPLFADGPLPRGTPGPPGPVSTGLGIQPGSWDPRAGPLAAGRYSRGSLGAVLPGEWPGGGGGPAGPPSGRLGLPVEPESFRLTCRRPTRARKSRSCRARRAWLAVAPGSGQAGKNWPLSHYYEVSRALAWEYKLGVVWLAGPAEAAWLPYLEALAAAQGQALLAGAPLTRVAAVLSRCRLFLGNDSGLTHLAAAVGGPAVVALFGPTDPGVWAPPGKRVRILTGTCAQAPCARGRAIPCPKPQCLEDLSPERVLAAAGAILA